MSDFSAALTGLAQGLTGYIQTDQKAKADKSQAAYQSQLDTQKDIAVNAAKNQDDGTTATPEATVNADMAEKMLPGAGGNLVQSFQQQNGRLPTMKEAHDYLKQAADSLQPPDTSKQDNQQDKLEQEFRTLKTKALSNRSGGLGLQDGKVNAAMHARQLIEGARDPKTGEVNINQITSPELAMSLSSIVSGGNAPALETIKSMTPESLQGLIKSKLGYIFGKPVDVLPKEWVDSLTHQIDRQGLTSEALRDNYEEQINRQHPTRLTPDRVRSVANEPIGVSYADTFGLPKMKFGDNPYKKLDPHGKQPPITGGETPAASSGGWSYVGPVKS